MKAEIISVGTELLLGHTVNTDAAYVARELSALGIDLLFSCTVGDNPARLREALQTAFARSDLVITCLLYTSRAFAAARPSAWRLRIWSRSSSAA